MQPVRPQPQVTGGPSSGRVPGSGLWPHSPAIALAPASGLPSTTMPPPTPVPRIAPNTTRAPAAAPSTASDRARQLASLAIATGTRSASCRSRCNGTAFEPGQVDHADRHAVGADQAGHADADRADGAAAVLQRLAELGQRRQGGGIVARHVAAQARHLAAALVQRDRRDLAAADVETDPEHRAVDLRARPGSSEPTRR